METKNVAWWAQLWVSCALVVFSIGGRAPCTSLGYLIVAIVLARALYWGFVEKVAIASEQSFPAKLLLFTFIHHAVVVCTCVPFLWEDPFGSPQSEFAETVVGVQFWMCSGLAILDVLGRKDKDKHLKQPRKHVSTVLFLVGASMMHWHAVAAVTLACMDLPHMALCALQMAKTRQVAAVLQDCITTVFVMVWVLCRLIVFPFKVVFPAVSLVLSGQASVWFAAGATYIVGLQVMYCIWSLTVFAWAQKTLQKRLGR